MFDSLLFGKIGVFVYKIIIFFPHFIKNAEICSLTMEWINIYIEKNGNFRYSEYCTIVNGKMELILNFCRVLRRKQRWQEY